MINKNLFFIDAESDGLYGKFLSVAVIIVNNEMEEIERHYWGISKENLNIKSKWVQDNVLPIMGDYEKCRSETELLENVWHMWEIYKDNAYVVADVIYPVETRLFEKCIQLSAKEREYQGPFPLIDLSSALLAKGIDPLKKRDELVERKGRTQHNALNDVEMSIEIWRRYISAEGYNRVL